MVKGKTISHRHFFAISLESKQRSLFVFMLSTGRRRYGSVRENAKFKYNRDINGLLFDLIDKEVGFTVHGKRRRER